MIDQISQVIKFHPSQKQVPWLPLLFFLSIGSLVALLIFVTLGFHILYLNRAYPGVSVAGVMVAGLTQREIEAAVDTQALEFLSHPITITAGQETWTFTPEQLGFRVNAGATADQTFQVGRRGNLLLDTLTHLSLIVRPHDVEPIIFFSPTISEPVLQPLIDVVNYPPRDARLLVRSATDIDFVPAQRGRRLHVTSTLEAIQAAVLREDTRPIAAVTQEVMPTVGDDDVRPVYEQIKLLLGRPLIFGFKTESDEAEWQLNPDGVANLITITDVINTEGKTVPALLLGEAALAPLLEEFAEVINVEPVDAQFEFDDDAGELTIFRESRDGRTLDVEAASKNAAIALATGSDFVALPVVLTPANVSSKNPESLGIKALISEETSYFQGSSQGRMSNIALAASKFHRVLVPPGEIFSFNEHLGPVTKENGYDESLIIFGNRTTVGIGGGVCQVSTTVFRTAFFGGLELVERWAHGYRVSWYETNSVTGLDATIYTPDLDFKFRNDTDSYLLIQTESDLDGGTVTFRFYGTPTDREVIVGDPVQTNLVKHGSPVYEQDSSLPPGTIEQIDWPKNGMDVSVNRVVKEGDVILHEDEIESHYRPWRAVYKVGLVANAGSAVGSSR